MFSALLFTLLAAAAQFALLVIGSPIAGDASFPLKARAPQNFVHPGIVIGQEQLDFVKSKVEAKQSPWFDAYQSLLTSRFGDLTREPKPRAVVDCGFYNKPDNGCTDESHDALTAYGTALLWYVTGEQKFADRSISIMNDWSKVVTAHTNQNAPVQAGWAAASWVKAAEIIRYSNAGWGDDDIQQFKKMLEEVYLPIVIPGSSYNGNWELGTQNPLLFLLLLLCNFHELVYTSSNQLKSSKSDDGSCPRHFSFQRRPGLIRQSHAKILRPRARIRLPHVRRSLSQNRS